MTTPAESANLYKPCTVLKHAGQEWNIEINQKLKIYKFNHSHSDPCAYAHLHMNKDFEVIVWVDNLLLFASSPKLK
jgi:hypothetical protein